MAFHIERNANDCNIFPKNGHSSSQEKEIVDLHDNLRPGRTLYKENNERKKYDNKIVMLTIFKNVNICGRNKHDFHMFYNGSLSCIFHRIGELVFKFRTIYISTNCL